MVSAHARCLLFRSVDRPLSKVFALLSLWHIPGGFRRARVEWFALAHLFAYFIVSAYIACTGPAPPRRLIHSILLYHFWLLLADAEDGDPLLIATAESSRRCRIVTVDVCAVPPLLVAGDAQGNVFVFAIPTDLLPKGAHARSGAGCCVRVRGERSGSHLEIRAMCSEADMDGGVLWSGSGSAVFADDAHAQT